MADGNAFPAIAFTFGLLGLVLWLLGRSQGPRRWLSLRAGAAAHRRIQVLESRALSSGCVLHLVRIDNREHLLAQTGGACTSLESWASAEGSK